MMNRNDPRAPAPGLALLAASALAVALLTGAAPSAISHAVDVDWPAGVVTMRAGLDLYAAGIRLPAGRSEAERSLAAAVPELVMGTVLSLPLDSWRTVADALDDGSLSPDTLREYLESGRRTALALSDDSRRLEGTWEWSLARLGALFIRHSDPVDQKLPDRFVPTRAYSGIIIYAKGSYPVRGEHRPDSMVPCLYPRIYDAAMDPILERNLLDPEALAAWGSVGYAYSLEDPAVELRAGGDPLRIIVGELFGSRRTDAVIAEADAMRILASPENRELIRQGRVVFLIDAP